MPARANGKPAPAIVWVGRILRIVAPVHHIKPNVVFGLVSNIAGVLSFTARNAALSVRQLATKNGQSPTTFTLAQPIDVPVASFERKHSKIVNLLSGVVNEFHDGFIARWALLGEAKHVSVL